MLKRYLIVLSAGLLLALSGLVYAQDTPSGKWWRLPKIAEEIKISQDEVKMLDDLYVQNRRKLIELKSGLEKQRFELDIIMEKDPLNETEVMDQYKRLEEARSNLAVERFRYLLEVRKIVGSQRYYRLKSIQKEFRKGRSAPQRNERSGKKRN